MSAFWSRESGLKAPLRIDSAQAIAAFQKQREALGVDGGMLIANPIPEASEIPQAEMNTFIEAAQADMEREGVTGKDVTPYLLGRIVELTGGRSLESNIALVKNNAKLATEIAVALSGR